MKPRHLLYLLLPMLAACQGVAPQPAAGAAWPDLRAEYQAQAAGGAVYAVDAAASTVRIYAYRAGAAAKFGHNHVLGVTQLAGYVSLPSAQPADARFELCVPLADLVIDDPAAREETGGNFAGRRSAADIEGTRANLLGARGLQADRFPLVRLRSLAVEGDWPMLVAQVEITLHGVTRTQPVLLEVRRDDAQLIVSGAMTLRQSDFGVTPFSALGGLLQVQDVVALRFRLVARPALF